MDDRKADADTHLANARSQNTGNGILGDIQKKRVATEVEKSREVAILM